jgi:hypothetical protein
MKSTTDIANDNGKPEDHLAAVTAALHAAMKGLAAPAELLDCSAMKRMHGDSSSGLHGDLVRETGHL